MRYAITTQRDLRKAFWRDYPHVSRRRIADHSGKGRMYLADTRVAWADYIDAMCHAGIISEALASRATLDG